MLINGWKSIAAQLHQGVRTAQRWEHFGLPVRRPAGHMRAAVIAVSEEIDEWAKTRPNGALERNTLMTHQVNQTILQFRETRSETRKLIAELRAKRVEQRHLLDNIVEHRNASSLRLRPSQAIVQVERSIADS